MRTCFKYNEEMYYSYYKYTLKIVFNNYIIKTVITNNSKFICPFCGHELLIKDNFNNHIDIYDIDQTKGKLHLIHVEPIFNTLCKSITYNYTVYIIKKLHQIYIGTFRTSPVYNQWHKYCRYNKYKIHNFKDYSDKEKKLVLKYNIDYSKEDEYEDGALLPTVKYNKQKPKLQTGGQRSNGWKNKKIRHQWEVNLKR